METVTKKFAIISTNLCTSDYLVTAFSTVELLHEQGTNEVKLLGTYIGLQVSFLQELSDFQTRHEKEISDTHRELHEARQQNQLLRKTTVQLNQRIKEKTDMVVYSVAVQTNSDGCSGKLVKKIQF